MTLPLLDVAVVGGGPVGVYLGCLLAQAGLTFAVLEQREGPLVHSRAIGIHPRALHGFARIGLLDRLEEAGVKLRRGLLLGGSGVLGTLDFGPADPVYPYILSLPQVQTERLLRARLAELAPGALQQAQVTRLDMGGAHCTLATSQGPVRARYVVAADGLHSALRRQADIAFPGGLYPDCYLMGDFPDTTPFGTDAVISLTEAGVTECFPLPGGLRRWVVHTGNQLLEGAVPGQLTRIIQQRTGLFVPAGECQMLSAFTVRRHLARTMQRGRLCLVGDAAHVVSPIGGQGMNLGWLDADALLPVLQRAVRGQAHAAEWQHWSAARRRAAWVAARQAEANMSAGRPTGRRRQKGREQLLRGLLGPALSPALAQAFTMRWL
ncbi:FAD-dependent oxidoreductase [Deinococcus lacus]|uniref:FAD-dependent oxidoreductase n=1 Tax=Deinococcus lacus TaxID=392561 RepID=A0ABW1YH16_9DEIO